MSLYTFDIVTLIIAFVLQTQFIILCIFFYKWVTKTHGAVERTLAEKIHDLTAKVLELELDVFNLHSMVVEGMGPTPVRLLDNTDVERDM